VERLSVCATRTHIVVHNSVVHVPGSDRQTLLACVPPAALGRCAVLMLASCMYSLCSDCTGVDLVLLRGAGASFPIGF
jgi:hypothetical protein